MNQENYQEETKQAYFKENEVKEGGSLTKLENSLNKSNPKMQLILEGSKIRQKQTAPMKVLFPHFWISSLNLKYYLHSLREI